MRIIAAKNILNANDQLADENRRQLVSQAVCGVNIVGSPGCGKTTLLESVLHRMVDRVSAAVIEGDIAGQVDADRIEKIGVPVVQINTEGMCHLDANMIAVAVADIDLTNVDILFVENVGNLVCTAGFDLGEHLRIVLLSVTEGDDKVVKYPVIFQRSDALIVTKTDMLPYCNFDVQRVRGDMKRLAPAAEIFEVSAVDGTGLGALTEWIAEKRKALHGAEE